MRNKRRCFWHRRVLLLTACLLPVPVVAAVSWTATQPTLSINKTLQDNPQLLIENQQSSTSMVLDANMALNMESNKTQAMISPRINAVRYNKSTELNADNRYLDMSLARDFVFNRLSVYANYSRQSTLAYELEDTGIIQANKWRNAWLISPVWTQEITPRMSTSVSFVDNQVSYENSEATTLVDYRYSQLKTSYQYDLNDQTFVVASANGGLLNASDISTRNRSYDSQLSIVHAISDTDHLNVKLGASRSQYVIQNVVKKANNGALGELSFSQEGVRTAFTLSVKRSLEPSGYGVMLLRDQASLNLSMQASENLRLQLNLRTLRDASQEKDLAVSTRRYEQSEIMGIWIFSRQWSLTCRYSLSGQQYSFDNEKRINNLVALTVGYRGQNAPLH